MYGQLYTQSQQALDEPVSSYTRGEEIPVACVNYSFISATLTKDHFVLFLEIRNKAFHYTMNQCFEL